MTTAPSDALAQARLRAEIARRDVERTLDEVYDRMKPMRIASKAFAKARVGDTNLLSLGLNLYRFRGTLASVIGIVSAVRAKKAGKEEAGEHPLAAHDGRHGEQKRKGDSMPHDLKETIGDTRDRIRQIADAAADRVVQLKDSSSSAAADLYARARGNDTSIGTRLARGARENPWATVAGAVAAGVLIGALLPRSRTRMSRGVQDAWRTVSDRLDDFGINRETARDTFSRAKLAARDAGSHAGDLARHAWDKARRGG